MQKEILEGFRLSPQQERLWLLQQGGAAFRAECAVELEGPLDARLLEAAWRAVVSRHEILRTTYEFLPGMTVPVQVIGENPDAAYSLREIDLEGRDREGLGARLEEIRREERSLPFDLERGPVVRLSLARLSAERHWLLVSLPSLCADARTLRNLLAELARGYAELTGEAPADADETVQYVDYSEWQHELLEEEAAKAAGASQDAETPSAAAEASPEELRLPGERRAGAGRFFEPAQVSFEVGAETSEGLRGLSARHGTTPAALLLAGWRALLWRLTNQSPAVETLFDGRKISHLRGALGLFARYIPVGRPVESDLRFTELLRQTDEAVAEAHSRQEYFARAAAAGDESADAARQSVGFEFDAWPRHFRAGALTLTPTSYCCYTEPFKLKLSVTEREGALGFDLHYDAARFAEAGVARLGEEFQAVLECIAARPESLVEELDVLGPAERELVVDTWNRTGAESPADVCVHTLFERQAAARPDATAVVAEDGWLSYAELNGR
ncbi:MAG TPA: condensation domain-containing protein, partial [Pyrinomonadaceae bacterium]